MTTPATPPAAPPVKPVPADFEEAKVERESATLTAEEVAEFRLLRKEKKEHDERVAKEAGRRQPRCSPPATTSTSLTGPWSTARPSRRTWTAATGRCPWSAPTPRASFTVSWPDAR